MSGRRIHRRLNRIEGDVDDVLGECGTTSAEHLGDTSVVRNRGPHSVPAIDARSAGVAPAALAARSCAEN